MASCLTYLFVNQFNSFKNYENGNRNIWLKYVNYVSKNHDDFNKRIFIFISEVVACTRIYKTYSKQGLYSKGMKEI